MLIVHVHIQVKTEYINDFISLTMENVRNSILEAGIKTFDFYQQNDDLNKFLLVEIYSDEQAVSAHKQTRHYDKWKTGVEEMMIEPRYSIKYANIFPED